MMYDESTEAKKKAMSLLERSDKTEWQLREKLKEKGFSEEVVEEAVEYVKSFHYIDDLRFATHFVEVYHTRRSIRRMRQDLYQKHVPEEYIDLALESANRDESMALARDLEKLLRGKGEISEYSYEEKQKLAAKLFRKGYEMSAIKKALDF